MFHSWQTSSTPPSSLPQSRNSPKTRRQSSTTHACEECRRRKIRCDGKLPCSHCEWYKHPKLCRYSKKQPRVVPSQRLLEELNGSLKQAQKVLAQLFPNEDVAKLGDLPRTELVELIHAAGARTPSSASSTSPPIKAETPSPFATHRSLSTESSTALDTLEPEPSPDADWDETEKFDRGGVVSDDVNALNMNVRSSSSYLGVSSIAAALRVMSKINKALGQVILGNNLNSNNAGASEEDSGGSSPSHNAAAAAETPVVIAQPSLRQPELIDAYFDHVHPLIPMVHEERFRQTYADGSRRDKSWRALLWMVLAMGTIAAATADDNSHLRYYHAARELMGLDVLGNGRIEALQALGLMGGLYLHYESLPNMANAVLGAALRMACALGLHREYPEVPSESRADFVRQATLIPREVRRRTWWSLFCLDTWATTTQGRPSLGRISPAVTVLPPAFLGNAPDVSRPLSITTDDALVLVLRYETAFCKIATRIQDRLAESPLLPHDETVRFDDELRAWRSSLPPMFSSDQPCPERAKLPRAVMSWRYHNLRLVLHRPILLNNALRSSLAAHDPVGPDEARLVAECRAIAADCIADIRRQWTRTQMSGWNGVWMLFQACMAPLVTAFAEFNRRDYEAVRAAQRQLESAIELLEEMADWSVTAKKTLAFVRKMYERSRRMMAQVEAQDRRMEENMKERIGGMSLLKPDERYPGTAPIEERRFELGQLPVNPEHHQMYDHAAAGMPHNTLPGFQPPFMAPVPESIEYQGLNLEQPELPSGPSGLYGMEQTDWMSQEEFQSFWNQVLWGEGEMPDFMMDVTNAAYDPSQYPTTSGGIPDPGYGAYGA